jgi:phosphate/sulfate permease
LENIYLYIIILLGILAIGDLIVGVSNDAVNFLNSAIGSKAISFRNIMILASLGIAFGAFSSSGMMEVARKGIFNPSAFFFDEIIYIFMAVMMTDILLLDFFNTLGLPTSTTVSIVFELLGAAVVMAAVKIINGGGTLVELSNYINTEKASQIILGILLSIFIAFTIGAISQWISRLIYSYQYDKKSASLNALFGGLALASIFNFILIKGIKSTPYANLKFEFLSGLTINGFIENNTILVNLLSFVFWYLTSLIIIRFLKGDIFKIIIGVGTFALALAFAGNDLVNFIGVPIAAFQSYEAWVSSGLAANEFSMGVLSDKVATPTLFLLLSGVVMILTLVFSSKAKKVVKTSLDLSNQFETRERFKPNALSRYLVRFFIGANHLFRKLLSKDQLLYLGKTFTPVTRENNGIGAPAFDKLRASINLVIAAILIAIATSYKLPLSTTYVAFMVAMGTSLADRAWGSDSAVFRVAGVLNVIGGWFLTAISAFTVGGVIVYLLYIGGVQVIAVIIFIILLLVGKNYIQHKKENKAIREEEIALMVESNSFQGVIEETGTTIEAVMGKSFDIFRFIIAGLSTNDIKSLEKARKKSNKLADEIEGLDNRLFYFIRNLEDSSIAASNFYIELLQYLHDLSEDLSYLSKISYNHLNNNHRKLKLAQIRELMFIETNLKNTFKEAREAFQQKQNIKEFQDVLLEKSKIFELIDDKINTQIERTRAEETSPRSTALYFNFLIRTKELITHKFELIDKYYTVVRKL